MIGTSRCMIRFPPRRSLAMKVRPITRALHPLPMPLACSSSSLAAPPSTPPRPLAPYLFNRQLLARPDGSMVLVAPAECREDAAVSALLERLISDRGTVREVLTFDLRQSMQNGGGPACLRLRVALTPAERDAVPARIWLDDALYAEIVAWVGRHYRDRLAPADLADPALPAQSRPPLDELSRLLRLGSVYPFQRV